MGTLCKIGQHDHISSLQRDGTVFMNTLDIFWNIEDGGLRGDPLDGIDHMGNGAKGKIFTTGGDPIPMDITSWTLQTKTKQPERINLFCMYAFHHELQSAPIDTRIFKFGDSALVFTHPDEFISRLINAARKFERKFSANLVTYVPTNFIGDIGIFKKTDSFEYQSEWRFAMFGGPGTPTSLSLGDLSDISILLKSNELPEFAAKYRKAAEKSEN